MIGTDDEPVRLDTVTAVHRGRARAARAPRGRGDTDRLPAPDKRLSNALLRSTGFTFAYPTYREGYRAVIAGDGTRHP